MSSAAFRHGPMEMLDARVFLLVFGGEQRTLALNESLVREVRAPGRSSRGRSSSRCRSRW